MSRQSRKPRSRRSNRRSNNNPGGAAVAKSATLIHPLVTMHGVLGTSNNRDISKGIPKSMIDYGSPVISPVPPVMRCIMTANGAFTLQTANPGFSDTVIKLNCLPVPYPSGGYEYSWYDEFASLYYKYKILSSAISVEAHPTSTAPMSLVVVPTAAASAYANIFDAAEQGYAKRASLQKGGNKDIVRINNFVNVNNVQRGDAFAAPVLCTADAADPAYWHILVAPDTAAAVDVTVYVRLTAEVIFDFPKSSSS